MDLGSECSALEFVEDNEFKFSESNSFVGGDAHKVEANGSWSNEIHDTASSGPAHANSLDHNSRAEEDHVGNSVSVNSPPSAAVSPVVGSPSSTKGKGLRKWRRFKRDVVKDTTVNADANKILKRGFSGSGNQTTKPNYRMPVEINKNDDDSGRSTNAVKNTAFSEGDLNHGFSQDSRFATGSARSPEMGSENSEDCSSKSSTAASAPRVTSDLPAFLGHVWERNRIKNPSVKGTVTSSPQFQHVKGRIESSKKRRGDRVKIEKENSHSSMESDSRSSNFFFMQGAYSVTSNGKLGRRSMNYDGENSDEAHGGEQQFDAEVQTASVHENDGEIEGVLQGDLAADASWENEEAKIANHQHSLDQDPLEKSILSLHSAQEALESEIQKLGDVGKVDSVPTDAAFTGPKSFESSPSDQFESKYPGHLSSLESQLLNLTENVACLESRLEEARTLLVVRESRVAELEAAWKNSDLTKGEVGNTIELEEEKSREIEAELEGLFKQKIEGEVEYMALMNTVQKLRVAVVEQITLLREQIALAGEQAQMVNKLGEAESKAEILQKQAEKLEKYSEERLGSEEVLRKQVRVFKVTSCFFVQLMLFMLVLWLLVLQLSPPSGFVVPT
uniref:WPP domain-interacting protein 1 n=1 Tax=Rhizophora mucronata TaxID=61149 RepID=A0A2P2MXZ2_RHIMU